MSPITLHQPSKYATSSTSSPPSPSLDFLSRTWSVTHSTLPMWRKARNVRITYSPLPSPTSSSPQKISDLVEYEPLDGSSLKNVRGVDTSSTTTSLAAWDWRGSGFLFFVTSHWEILGFGEVPETGERWVVTWFQKTLFTAEGVDVYSDRPEGPSEEIKKQILEGLNAMEGGVGELCRKDMREVRVELPWREK
ncbi:hypothetical protein QBC40DRAFT_1327 [Triangularia verruculosa]|uniref:Uncharacterized protein n=1 Tax=Triangularia verruculosa TaxID=2587418 RepID=A0AAN7B298_9PEZI|nr:hypothetical protein QBC40DRAFT_1327 [Triangularia verruculosa]